MYIERMSLNCWCYPSLGERYEDLKLTKNRKTQNRISKPTCEADIAHLFIRKQQILTGQYEPQITTITINYSEKINLFHYTC